MTLTRTLLVAAAFSLAALCLAACANDPKAPGPTRAAAAVNPLELYPLKAEPARDQIALAIHAEGLSGAQVEAVRAFLARRLAERGGQVTLKVPGGADPAIAARAQSDLSRLLAGAGIPSDALVAVTYAAADPKAPLMLSFDYEQPEVAKCGKDWDDLAKTGDNLVYGNFGCAVTANMAAQIANPDDLVHPRAEDAPDAERRMTVLDKYRAGKVTAADAPQDKAGGAIAHIGQ